jgi:hypothetical protein
LIDEDLVPEIQILEIVEEGTSWEERERYWIAFGREAGWSLTNMTEGGDGLKDPSPEVRAKLSRAAKGKRYAGGKRSNAFRKRAGEIAKVTKNALGHTVSDESRQQISENLKAWYDQGGEAPHGEDNGQSKLTTDQVREIRQRYAEGGISMRKLAKDYPVQHQAISLIINRKLWSHI